MAIENTVSIAILDPRSSIVKSVFDCRLPVVMMKRIIFSDVLGNKIPRPMNAFMIFGNQHRPRLKARMPTLTNKEISVK